MKTPLHRTSVFRSIPVSFLSFGMILSLHIAGCAPEPPGPDSFTGGTVETLMTEGAMTPVTLRFLEGEAPTPVRAYFSYRNRPYIIGPQAGYHFPVYWDRFYQDHYFVMRPGVPILDFQSAQDHHYYFLSGEATILLPPGPMEVTAYKGLEFRPSTTAFEVGASAMTQDIPVSRWIDMPQRGWYSGDIHIHLGRTGREDSIYVAMQEADGLHVGHYLQLQRIWQGAVQTTWGDAGQAQRDRTIVRSGEEPRSMFGHKLLLGIDRLALPVGMGDIAADQYAVPKLSVDIFEEGRAAGGIVGYAHGNGLNPASATTIDLPLGAVDFLEIFQFNELRKDLWYEALSAGYRVPPAAGTDFPVNVGRRIPWPHLISPLSAERMYVQVDSNYTFDSWMEQFKAGRVLLTNGPVIEFTVNSVEPGGEVRVPDSEANVAIEINVDHWRPMKECRLIANGRVLQTFENPQQRKRWKIQARGPVAKSMWMAVHVLSDSTDDLNDDGILLQAHTAPVYVLRHGKPIRDADALNALIKRVEFSKSFYQKNSKTWKYANASMEARLMQRCDEAIAEYKRRLEETTKE